MLYYKNNYNLFLEFYFFSLCLVLNIRVVVVRTFDISRITILYGFVKEIISYKLLGYITSINP